MLVPYLIVWAMMFYFLPYTFEAIGWMLLYVAEIDIRLLSILMTVPNGYIYFLYTGNASDVIGIEIPCLLYSLAMSYIRPLHIISSVSINAWLYLLLATKRKYIRDSYGIIHLLIVGIISTIVYYFTGIIPDPVISLVDWLIIHTSKNI